MSEARWGGQLPTELVPENAPFDEEQRAWLNGFLAGLLGLAGSEPRAAVEARASGPENAKPEPEPGARAWALGGAARRSVRSQVGDLTAPAALRAAYSAVRPRLVGQGRERREAQRVRVKSQKKLTLADAGSEIREVVLELTDPDLTYRAGDCLAVFPHNDPDLVRSLLRAVGARGQELVTTANGSCEVWRCLLEDVDITHVRDETLQLFVQHAGRGEDVRTLRELLSQGAQQSFDLLDLLAMFPSSRPSIDQIASTLGVLEPRLYAIASAPSSHPAELHLAVRMVRVERGGRERKGVASHFLSEGVFRGDEVSVQIHSGDRFVLPEDLSGPMIMLGSGTGVARYRAFLQELEARGRRGNTWLIMASYFEGDEALYEAELKAWSRLGVLEHLDVVKLGQRGRRVGLEDVLRKRARRVVSWLDRGAVVYACGEGKALSAVLDDALIEVLGRQGKMSRTEAAEFVHVMRRDGRYVEEVY